MLDLLPDSLDTLVVVRWLKNAFLDAMKDMDEATAEHPSVRITLMYLCQVERALASRLGMAVEGCDEV